MFGKILKGILLVILGMVLGIAGVVGYFRAKPEEAAQSSGLIL